MGIKKMRPAIRAHIVDVEPRYYTYPGFKRAGEWDNRGFITDSFGRIAHLLRSTEQKFSPPVRLESSRRALEAFFGSVPDNLAGGSDIRYLKEILGEGKESGTPSD